MLDQLTQQQLAWDVLASDDLACFGLLEGLGGSDRVVPLIVEDLSVREALAYARTLIELGLDLQAREVFEGFFAPFRGEGWRDVMNAMVDGMPGPGLDGPRTGVEDPVYVRVHSECLTGDCGGEFWG